MLAHPGRSARPPPLWGGCPKLQAPFFFFFPSCQAQAHRALDAPGRLPEELRFGVSHLGGVEELLAFHLLQDEHSLEDFGS